MEFLPAYISILFVLTTALTVFIFFMASNRSRKTLLVMLIWLAIQMAISVNGFYKVTDQIPPRFILLIGPPIICILFLFFLPAGRKYLDQLNLKYLTMLHIVRIPVELVLYSLYIHKAVPELMTFSGRNFDILSGLSAVFIYYFGYAKKNLNNKILLVWNVVCLLLLLNIVIHAILSAPFPFQQFAFEQPNIAVLHFPFTWLPCCIVPLVLVSHLVAIRKLLKLNNQPSIQPYIRKAH